MEDKDKSWFEELLIKGDKLQTFVGENRQKGIDSAAQKVDEVVTGTLQDWNVPGAQFIGDRARNITGLTADLYTPEAWEIPLYLGAQVEPSPLGEAAIYGAGRINKARRLLKGVQGKTLTGVKSVVESNLPNITRVIDDVFSTVHKHINGHSVYQEAGTGMPIRVDGKMNPNIMQSTTKGGGGGYYSRADMSKQKLNMQVRMAGSGMGFKDNVFNFDEYLKVRSKHSETDRRWFAGIFSTPVDYNTYRKGFATSVSEKAYKKRLKADFMKTYPPEFLKAHKLKPGDIQAHHIDALMASLPLYDGVEYLSKEWYDITGALLAKNVHAGNQAKNLRYLVGRRGWPETPHGITHVYLDEIAGPDGTLLFTEAVRNRMRTDKAFRIEMTNKWGDIVLKSNQIADQAAGVFNAMNADLLNLQPKDIDTIMSSLAKLEVNGLVKPELIKGRWQIGADEMRELLFDIDFTQNIGQHFLLANPKGLRALRIALQSKDPITQYQAIRSTLPKQLSLFDEAKINKLVKKTSRSNKNQQKYFKDPDVTKPPK